MRELFVYYRVRAAQAEAARPVALAIQAALSSRHPALTARLLRRDECTHVDTGANENARHENDSTRDQTWMETYVIDPRIDAAGLTPALQAEIEACAQALTPFLSGARHTEVFIACAWP